MLLSISIVKSVSIGSGVGIAHPQLRSIEAVAEPSELVAVAVRVYVSPGLFIFTCAFLFPKEPRLSSLLQETEGLGLPVTVASTL